MQKLRDAFVKSKNLLRKEGVLGFTIVVLQHLRRRKQRTGYSKKIKHSLLVKTDDAIEADWTRPTQILNKDPSRPYKINWVISPPDRGFGGGHQNIFRFINTLSEAGHDQFVYLYSNVFRQSTLDARDVIKSFYPNIKLEVFWLEKDMRDSDALFATGWETAYPVFNAKNTYRKFYFIQDFEPYFYPMGTEYVLAENTYKMNFKGITAGAWLAKKISSDYNMKCSSYDFGADTQLYRNTNHELRKEIFFYARPVTARRGFELGLMALEIFHQKMPDYIINLAGWDVSEYEIPFPYANLKSLSLDELPAIYNRCTAALVISLTNMSLLPLELLACGVIPVMNEGENNSLVSNNKHIIYTKPSPAALAQALIDAVSNPSAIDNALKASESVRASSWQKAAEQFIKIVEEELHA